MKKMILHLDLAELPPGTFPKGKIADLTLTMGDVTQDLALELTEDITLAGADASNRAAFAKKLNDTLTVTSDGDHTLIKAADAVTGSNCMYLLSGAFEFEGDGRALVGLGAWTTVMANAVFADVELADIKLSQEGLSKGAVVGIALVSALLGNAAA